MTKPLVALHGIHKRFGATVALRDAHLDAYAGETHVILGENGAGKTSLMSVLAGLYQPDAGEIQVEGRPAAIRTPADSLRLGIAMVPQHVELVTNLTVWENVVLGEPGSGWLRRGQVRQQLAALAAELGLGLDVDRKVLHLSPGQQQKVEILKTLWRQARIVIFDEPTTFLTPQETDSLYETIAALTARGLTVLLITHKIRDALRIGQRLTVMRAGQVVAALPATAADEATLVRHLMGAAAGDASRLLDREPPTPLAARAPTVLELSGVAAGGGHRMALQDVYLRLHQGEIHGIAGVTGSGQGELAEAILGLLPVHQGSIHLGERTVHTWSVAQRQAAGLGLIPQDRIHDGILPGLPLYESVLLGQQREVFPGLRYQADTARRLGEAAIRQYAVKAPNADEPAGNLSGGNIQKLLVARAVAHALRHPAPVLVAVNPTRGLDIRTVRQVHDRLRDVAAAGGAVLLMSEDLDELMAECHAISVLHHGRLVARFAAPEFDRYQIGAAMLGQQEVRR